MHRASFSCPTMWRDPEPNGQAADRREHLARLEQRFDAGEDHRPAAVEPMSEGFVLPGGIRFAPESQVRT
jgi:hypothetical protein